MKAWLATVGLSLSIALSACGPDGDEYIAANEALLEEVPLFPASEEIMREDSAYRLTESGTVTGYGTRVTYRAPPNATETEVANFFRESIDSGWRSSIQETPTIDVVTGRRLEPTRQYHFCRMNQFIGVDALNVPLNGTFDLYVDHNYGQDGTRVMPCA